MKKGLGILIAFVMLMTCCFSAAPAETAVPEAAETAVPEATETAAPEAAETVLTLNVNGQDVTVRTNSEGKITFIDGSCTDAPVKSTEDAAALVAEITPRIGGSKTSFVPWRTLYDSFGNTYYLFQQVYADTIVDGGAVKVITDRDGNMLGLTASVVSDLPEETAAEGISAAAAEQLVLQHEKERGLDPILMDGMTRKIVLPVDRDADLEAEDIRTHFVWAVFSNNPSSDAGKEMPYLAHYVSMAGEYLYCLPTLLPGDQAGESGYHADYVFEFMEPVEYTGYVDLSDGTEKEITVNVMRDTRTGMYYLGNIEHRIVVADCWEFLYNHGNVKLVYSPDNREWDQVGLLSLYNYCRAYDYYKAIGWQGDGEDTPIMILKDFCDKDHKPMNNACYAGKFYGWQTFLSSSANDFAQCLDIIGHEFTHCVTASVMTYNAYLNDFGAINEAMSDIQGNICEMLAGDTEDTTWTVGEHSTENVRVMSDPHQGKQPSFTWDLYYQPHVKDPTNANDRGGVHTNSSLLNYIAWMLCDGGMTLEDARAYWFAADCAMVPGTDYAQLRDLLPWVMKITGLEKHMDTLTAALEATRLGEAEMPDPLPENRALVTLDLPDTEIFNNGSWLMSIICLDFEGIGSRLTAISEDLENGKTEGYPKMLVDLYNQAAEENAAGGEPEETPSVLSIFADALLGGALDGEDSETEPPAEDSTMTPEEKAEAEEFRTWLKQQAADVFYMGNASAGQDGHTIRMVTTSGRAIPILLYLETKPNSDQIKQMNAVIYLKGRWIDLTPLAALMLNEEGASPVALAGGLLKSGLLFDLMEIIFTCRTTEDYLNALSIGIPAGGVLELPSKGLETVTFEANMAGMADMTEVETNNRMSRPKE